MTRVATGQLAAHEPHAAFSGAHPEIFKGGGSIFQKETRPDCS